MVKRALSLAFGILIVLVIKTILEPDDGEGKAEEQERLTCPVPDGWQVKAG